MPTVSSTMRRPRDTCSGAACCPARAPFDERRAGVAPLPLGDIEKQVSVGRGSSERGSPATRDLVSLSGGQDAELMTIGIGHDHPTDFALANVDASRSEGNETVDLRLLITVDGWSEVEMQPVLPGLRRQGRAAPGDLRAAVRRANRGLLVLIPDQRPAQRFAPEVPDFLGTLTGKRSDESAVGEKLIVWLDDAELIAFGVGEHNVSLLRSLTNVEVPGAEPERPRHRLLLVLKRRARQIEMHLVLADLLLTSWKKLDLEPGVIARQERNAVLGVVGHLPTQDAGPEARETERVVRIEGECNQVTSQFVPHFQSADPRPQKAHVLRAHRQRNSRRSRTC